MIEEENEWWGFSKADIRHIIKWALIISLGLLGLFIAGVELMKRF